MVLKQAKYVIAVAVSAAILAVMLLFIFGEKKEFSENENRFLAEAPEFSADTVTDGSFMNEAEEYLKDHFPARDTLMKLKTRVQLAAGYRKISDVYVGEDRLFQNVKQPDKTRLTISAKRLFDEISKENIRIRTSVLLVPTASEVYRDELPPHASSNIIDQKALIDNILSDIDCDISQNAVYALESHKDDGENLFYYTDHHWTTYAALASYNAFAESAGLTEFAIEKYKDFRTLICKDFRGTLYSKVLDDRLSDEIYRCDYLGMNFSCKSALSGIFDGLSDTDYYAEEWLGKKDKYAYFGDGNPPLTVLENENSKTENEIVLIKDSYANCFAPFLTVDYRRVHIIDPRYFKGMKISNYIKKNPNISDVLILYGINSLNDNTGVSTLS